MRIKRIYIIFLFVANILLAFLCVYMLDPRSFFSDPEMFWSLPLAITFVSVVVFILSRIAEVAINKRSKINAVYFWGQTAVTLVIFGFYTWIVVGRADRAQRDNANFNRNFVKDQFGYYWNDTLRYKALDQLENTLANKNDIRLDYYSITKMDTVIDEIHDSVALIHFMYTMEKNPGIPFLSKHMIGEKIEKMIYYHIPFYKISSIDSSFSKSRQRYKEMLEMARQTAGRQATELIDKELEQIEKEESIMKDR